MVEIEKKFLVKQDIFPRTSHSTVMKQGYLSVDKERVVRVRIEGDKAWLTIKGKMQGISRPEFEYEIPTTDAEQLLKLCMFNPVEKIRHRIEANGQLWEVDEFIGLNKGLILAEIELDDENQSFTLPEWIGEEVTHDHRYYNSWLAANPYTTWQKPETNG